MAQIIKYNSPKDSDNKRNDSESFSIGATLTTGSSTSETTTQTINANCNIWGQKFNGSDDITGTLKITEGDLYVKKSTWEEDDDDDSEGIEDENDTEGMTGEGNAYIEGDLHVDGKSYFEGKTTAKDIESVDMYATNALYIPHPTTKAKTDIVDLLKGYDTRISTNATNIATNTTNISNNTTAINNLKTTVNSHTTSINNLNTNVSNNTTNIATNTADIAELKGLVSGLGDDIEGFSSATIIDENTQWNGTATNTNTNSGFVFKNGANELSVNPQLLNVLDINDVDGYVEKRGFVANATGQGVTGNSYSFAESVSVDCGAYPAGAIFKVDGNSIRETTQLNLEGSDGTFTNLSHSIKSVYIFQGSSIVQSATTETQIKNLSNYSFTAATNNERFSIRIRVEGSFNFSFNGGLTTMPSVKINAYANVSKPIAPKVELRSNGIFVVGGFEKYIFSNKEKIRIKFANAALQFSERGVEMQNPNTLIEQYVPLHSVKKINRLTNINNYQIQDDDEILINYGKTKDLDWYLPDSTWTGRIVTIIDIANDSAVKLHITTSNKNLFYNNSYNLSNSVDINNTAKTFIFDGTYWIVMAS